MKKNTIKNMTKRDMNCLEHARNGMKIIVEGLSQAASVIKKNE